MMKRFTLLLIALLLFLPNSNAADNQLDKAQKKAYQQKKKEFEKGGWKLFGDSRTLDEALLDHYKALYTQSEDSREVIGIATEVRSKNDGRQIAMHNACITYSQQSGSQLKGQILNLSADGDSEMQTTHFQAAYEQLVQKEIRGKMKESFTIMRETAPGIYEFQSFFIIHI